MRFRKVYGGRTFQAQSLGKGLSWGDPEEQQEEQAKGQ